MDNEPTVMAQGQEEEDQTAYPAEEEKTYTFHEEHLMSTYTPRVVDCSSRIGMLLVEWFKTPASNSRHASSSSSSSSSSAPSTSSNKMLCRSWVNYQDFPFPSAVMSYVDNQLQTVQCDKEEEHNLKKLLKKCDKFAKRLEESNTFTYQEDDPDSMLE
eukprot:scaffold54643_cov24-Attheya_sp.AAC.1